MVDGVSGICRGLRDLRVPGGGVVTVIDGRLIQTRAISSSAMLPPSLTSSTPIRACQQTCLPRNTSSDPTAATGFLAIVMLTRIMVAVSPGAPEVNAPRIVTVTAELQIPQPVPPFKAGYSAVVASVVDVGSC